MYYITCFILNEQNNNIPIVGDSTIDPSGHFDYSYVDIHRLNVEDFVVESATMVIFKYSYVCSLTKKKR